MGYDCGGYGADGDFGTGTYNSVLRFQKNYGLEQDGVVGTKTSQAIANALKTGNNGVPNYIMNKINTSSTVTTTPSTSTNNTGNLQSGSKGSAVKDLQEKLIRMGYDCGGYGADGDFGTGTYNSVVKFQKDHGLTQDGVVGNQTNQAIDNALKTGNNGVPNYIMGKINASSTGSSTPSAGSSYSTTMQSGSKGNAVVELQKNLITMGYDCGKCGADGDFGTGTYNAVKKFQSDYGLTQDGIAGPQTNQAIANALKTGNNGVPNYIMHKSNASSTASSTVSIGITLQSGNKGSDVKKLQENLITMGYDCGRCGADGDFGQDTYNAVKKFQSDYGLTQDGIAGPQTNQAIANALKTGNNGVPNYIMHKSNANSTASSTVSIGITLQSGNKGNEVKKLQQNLITMGYECGRCGADGDFGQDTYNAVKQFQSDYGLSQDGIAGPQTNQAIANALKTGSNGVPNYIMHKSNAASVIAIQESYKANKANNDTLFNNITKLSLLAKDYTDNKLESNQLVMMFIRQSNKSYTSSTWDMVAGKIDSEFIEYVNQKSPSITDYFSGNLNIMDVNSGQGIELTHFAATLGGLLYSTSAKDGTSFTGTIKGQLMPESHLDNLCGWAGDLQTLMLNMKDKTNNSDSYDVLYNETKKAIGANEYSFSMTDLLADVDAVNIRSLVAESDSLELGLALSNYYSSGNEKRYTDFVKNVVGSVDKGKFMECVSEYTKGSYFGFGWPLLDGKEFTENQQQATNGAFSDYIWGRVYSEV